MTCNYREIVGWCFRKAVVLVGSRVLVWPRSVSFGSGSYSGHAFDPEFGRAHFECKNFHTPYQSHNTQIGSSFIAVSLGNRECGLICCPTSHESELA